ncbi:YxlC family protein [Paenibacillus sp. GYB004]|uniref:YxlC family protein n=1 Tax=Paenibacillus sp. GYB004 TaxID=2994393 RepID=UPI002F96BB41
MNERDHDKQKGNQHVTGDSGPEFKAARERTDDSVGRTDRKAKNAERADTLPGEDEESFELSSMIKRELDKMERWTDPNTPNTIWFERLVVAGKREARRKLIRDLILFWLAGLGVLAVYGAISFGRPAVFIAIQLLAIAAVPFVVAVMRRKAGDRT